MAFLMLWLCMGVPALRAEGEAYDLAAFRLRAASDRAAGIAEGRAVLDAELFKDDPVGERMLLWYMGGAALGIPDDVALDEEILRLRSLQEQRGDTVAGAYAGFLRGARLIDLGTVGAGLAEVLRAANVVDVSSDPRQRAIAAGELCSAYARSGRPEQAIEHCRRYTSLMQAGGDPVTLARAQYLQAVVLSNVGQRKEAIQLWRQARQGFLEAGLHTLAGRAAGSLAVDLVLDQRHEEALELAKEAIAAAEAAGNASSVSIARGVHADALAGLGRLDEALEEVERAISAMEVMHAPGPLGHFLSTKLEVRQAQGAPEDELEGLRQRIQALESSDPDEEENEEIVSLESRYLQREQALRIRELEHENRLRQHELRVAELDSMRQAMLLREQRRFMLMATIAVVALIVTSVALVLLLRAQRRLARSFREQAYRDALTSLPNRRAILERIGRLLEAPGAADKGHALIMIDVDHFKAINDLGGHPFGDAVLYDVGMCLLRMVPQDGMVARLGGEEFLMLCPDIGRDAALALAERIRLAVHGLARPVDDRMLKVTVSQGVAVFDGVECHDLSSWMQKADRAAYLAKANGRDRVELAVSGASA